LKDDGGSLCRYELMDAIIVTLSETKVSGVST